MSDAQQRAQAAYKAGDFTGAVEAFQTAIGHAPHDPSAWLGLGFALFSLNDFHRAVEAFRESLTLSGGTAEAHYGLALALCSLHDDIGAAQELEAALALHPDHPAAKRSLVVALVKAGKAQQALGHLSAAEDLLTKAYRADHKHPDAILALIEYYKRVNLFDEAAEVVQQAMEDVPHLPGIHDFAAEFGLQKQRERGWIY